MRFPRLAAMLVLPALLLAACGVDFAPAEEGNEFFQSLEVTGTRQAGATLTAALDYETYYPVTVEIACELRQGKNLVKEIGKATAPELPSGEPDMTPVPGNFSFDFVVDAPGRYKVECFTPADEDNYITEEFTVS